MESEIAKKAGNLLIVILLATLAIYPFLSMPAVDASPPTTSRQRVNLFLAEEGVLSPLSDRELSTVETSSSRAAAWFTTFYSENIGTWETPNNPDGFSVEGPVNFEFWLAGDVSGVVLEMTLTLYDNSVSYTTDPKDLTEEPVRYSGSFSINNTWSAGSNTPLTLNLAWRGGQSALDSLSNNTVELFYGIHYWQSGISLRMNPITITEATSRRHPTQDDALLFEVRATSMFGLDDIVGIDITARIDEQRLTDISEAADGDYKVFTATWDYSRAELPGGVFVVILVVEDSSGNLWERETSIAIIVPEEVVDLSIIYSQVVVDPSSPVVGDGVNITVRFTGVGKNWGSVNAGVQVFINNALLEEKQVTATLGSNGPFRFTWIPAEPGEHQISVVLDESIIDAPGLNDTNNRVDRMMTVLPSDTIDQDDAETGLPPFVMLLGLTILVVVVASAVASFALSAEKRKSAERRKHYDEKGKYVPEPMRQPKDAPSGFFVHNPGKASVWVNTSKKS